jgi:hypothetical protein
VDSMNFLSAQWARRRCSIIQRKLSNLLFRDGIANRCNLRVNHADYVGEFNRLRLDLDFKRGIDL